MGSVFLDDLADDDLDRRHRPLRHPIGLGIVGGGQTMVDPGRRAEVEEVF